MKTVTFRISLFVLFTITLLSCKKNINRLTTESDIFPFYQLVWQDEFDGTQIDSTKWDFRQNGTQRFNGFVSNKTISLNGQGQLAIKVLKERDKYYIGQLSTQHTYLPTYGYFECRAKMLGQVGPHTSFWMQSPTIAEATDNPAANGAEMDVFEYHRSSAGQIYHNIYWNGYNPQTMKNSGTLVRTRNIGDGFHTFGMEWTSEGYVFFIDGYETWRTNQGISQRSEYMILSTELNGFGGDPSKSIFPDSAVFDYVRVYQKKP